MAFEESPNPQKQNEIVRENLYADLAETRLHANSFAIAIENYNRLMNEEDYKTAAYVKAWLRGDSNIPFTEKRKFGVKGDVTKENAINFLEALSVFVKSIGYAGLLVLIDEAEFIMNLHTKKLRDIAYNYIRDIYDNCNLGKFQNTLFLFAGTPELFENDKKGIPTYEALDDRLKNVLKGKVTPRTFIRSFISILDTVQQNQSFFKNSSDILEMFRKQETSKSDFNFDEIDEFDDDW